MLTAEANDGREATEDGILHHVLQALFNMSALCEPLVGSSAAHASLELGD